MLTNALPTSDRAATTKVEDAHRWRLARVGRIGTDLALLIAVVLFVRFQLLLLTYLNWGDESETIVAARMIASGDRLYEDIFNHHGPLIFVPATILELLGDPSLAAHRSIIIAMNLLTLAAVYFSPVFSRREHRNIATVFLATAIITFGPSMYGHTYTYDPLAGTILAIVISQFVLPAIVRPETVTGVRAIFGFASIGCLPFLAVTFLPIAIALALVTFRRRYAAHAGVGLAIGLAFNVICLITMGSLTGFLVMHFYVNFVVLPQTAPAYGASSTFMYLITAAGKSMGILLLLAVLVVAALHLTSRELSARPWRAALLAFGTATLLVRGDGFHALPFYYAALAVSVVLLTQLPAFRSFAELALIAALLLVCIVKLTAIDDAAELRAGAAPEDSEFAEIVRAITDEDDRIIVYTFRNSEYLLADRLPAAAHYFYLAAQGTYDRNPVWGVELDACTQIAQEKPRIMYVDGAAISADFPWSSYGGCIDQLLEDHYVQVLDRPYYVRADLTIPSPILERLRP